MSEPIEVVRKEFSESYVSLRVGGLYAWWQVEKPEWVRLTAQGEGKGLVLVVRREELLQLAWEMDMREGRAGEV